MRRSHMPFKPTLIIIPPVEVLYWLMASGELLADAGRASSSNGCGAGNESSPGLKVHTGSFYGYLAGCKGPILLYANAASKQNVEVGGQRIVIIHNSVTRLGHPAWPPGLSHMASWTTSRISRQISRACQSKVVSNTV